MTVKTLRETKVARPLTQRELHRRIECVFAEIDCRDGGAGDDLRPRWIEPAELIRRMRPFIVLN